jgi:hypothetical protein
MKSYLFTRTIVSLAIGSFAVFSGCSPATSPKAKTTTIKVAIPNVGSYWTYSDNTLDSNGVNVHTAQNTRTVVQTNMTYGGYTDVVMTVETTSIPNFQDTVYLRYLPSGDIMRSSSPSIDPSLQQWFTLPYGTEVGTVDNYGGAISALGFTHDTVAYSNTFQDSIGVLIGSTNYPAKVITSNTWETLTSSSKDSTYQITQTTTFLPTLGIFGDHDVETYSINGKKVNRVQQKLIGALVK